MLIIHHVLYKIGRLDAYLKENFERLRILAVVTLAAREPEAVPRRDVLCSAVDQ